MSGKIPAENVALCATEHEAQAAIFRLIDAATAARRDNQHEPEQAVGSGYTIVDLPCCSRGDEPETRGRAFIAWPAAEGSEGHNTLIAYHGDPLPLTPGGGGQPVRTDRRRPRALTGGGHLGTC